MNEVRKRVEIICGFVYAVPAVVHQIWTPPFGSKPEVECYITTRISSIIFIFSPSFSTHNSLRHTLKHHGPTASRLWCPRQLYC